MLANAGLFTDMEALADSVREDLKAIGIRLRIEAVAWDPFFDRLADVRAKVPMAISPSWQKDILNASTFFTPLFSSESIPGRTQSLDEQNFSLVGAPRAQLRDWGYDVTTVPSIDAKIDECLALVGDLQFRCWAEADQRLMAKVVPGIPFVFEKKVQLVSDRVVAYSFAQFSISPALDRIAIASDAA
jgi:ABC-type transport system substrate-binding protein